MLLFNAVKTGDLQRVKRSSTSVNYHTNFTINDSDPYYYDRGYPSEQKKPVDYQHILNNSKNKNTKTNNDTSYFNQTYSVDSDPFKQESDERLQKQKEDLYNVLRLLCKSFL